MKILSIETSCDETAISLLDISGPLESLSIKVLGNSLFSQIHLHQEYGGVYPNLAKREHIKNLPPLLEKTLKEAGENSQHPNIDYIAVTQGPGLEPALWTGITFAQELSKKWSKPLVPVNHMEGHIYSVLYKTESNPKSEILNSKLELPALALLVSGGHTELVLVKDFGQYEIIGKTRDDAVGEAFDKVARMLGLPYPGGPQISKLAHKARERHGDKPETLRFPRPMLHSHDLDFSFSGLKTAVLYGLRSLDLSSEEVKEDVARAFEDAAVEVLVSKTSQALKLYDDKISTLLVGGGVAANTYLKTKLSELQSEFPHLSILLPESPLTTDNAVMIGIAAYVRTQARPDLILEGESMVAKGNLLLSS